MELERQEHPDAALTRRVFEAFGRRDGAVVVAALAEDVRWRIVGSTRFGSEYRGRRAVVDFLRLTTGETDDSYRSDLRWVLGDDELTVALYRATGRRQGRELDIDQLFLIRCEDGRWADVTAVPLDPPSFNAFWA